MAYFTKASSGFLAVALLCSVIQPGFSQGAKKDKEAAGKSKYVKIVPKTEKFSALSKVDSYSELSEPPKDFAIPVYSGRFTYGSSKSSSLGKTQNMQIISTDKVEPITQWYRSQLKSQGWQLQESVPTNGASDMTGYKTGMLCRVTMRSSGAGTDINLSVTQKK